MATFNSGNSTFQSGNKTLFETQMLATPNGHVVSNTNPLPVTLGSDNITITGSVNIGTTVTIQSSPEDPVDMHIRQVGTSGILDVPYLPISGNVVISNGYVTTQNTSFSNQTIFVNGGQSNIGNFPASVNTSIHHSNGANITSAVPLPVTASIVNPVSLLYSFNNFGVFSHRGWSVSDTLIPMFSIRAKSTATNIVNINNYDIGNNNANQSTIGYIWIEDAVISGSVPSWTSLNSQAEYRFYTDAYGSNTPNGVSGGTQRHAGIIIGKNSSAESDIADINMIAGGVTLTLCLIRLDSATKLDVWVAVDLSILS